MDGLPPGALAGTLAAAAVALMPRLFGHAHLAALDMLTTLFFVAAVLAVAQAANVARDGRRRHGWRYAAAGVVWGMAMLVRLHGLLLAPPVILWLVWRSFQHDNGGRWAWKSVLSEWRNGITWLLAGVATFVAGWPWLWATFFPGRSWLASLERFQLYLASGTARQAIHVFYIGQVWADRNVPWHYPWVMFAVTVPLGLLLLGILGIWAKWRSWQSAGGFAPAEATLRQPLAASHALRATTIFLLLGRGETVGRGDDFHSGTILPAHNARLRRRAAVFDGFPTVGNLGGVGRLVVDRPRHHSLVSPVMRNSRNKPLGHDGGFCVRGVARLWAGALAPCHLCYYNLAVGGLAGAERLGFEATYWGDTVREPMLAEAARRSEGRWPHVLFVPNLAFLSSAGRRNVLAGAAGCEGRIGRMGRKAIEHHNLWICGGLQPSGGVGGGPLGSETWRGDERIRKPGGVVGQAGSPPPPSARQAGRVELTH